VNAKYGAVLVYGAVSTLRGIIHVKSPTNFTPFLVAAFSRAQVFFRCGLREKFRHSCSWYKIREDLINQTSCNFVSCDNTIEGFSPIDVIEMNRELVVDKSE